MYLYNMRNILLTLFTSLLLIGCTSTTTHNTYNCKCEQCGSSCTSPSDTISGPTEDEALTEEPILIEEGEQ